MPALGTIVTTTTQSRLLSKAVDNILNGNVLLARLIDSAQSWVGGTSIDVPVFLTSAGSPGITTVGSYSGFDTLNTTQENTRQRASAVPSQEYVSIPVSGIQRAVNKGPEAVINLLQAEIDYRTKALKDEMGTQLYSDGTGNSSKDLLGLQAAVGDTTTVTTYLGLSRATYTSWASTVTAQSGSLSLANLAADYDAAQVGGELPTLMVSTPAVFTIFEALMTPTVSNQFTMNDFRMVRSTVPGTQGGSEIVRVGGTLAANGGFRALTFRGIPFVADEKCTSGNIYTLNENNMGFYTISQDGIEGRHALAGGFYMTDFKEPVNQDASVAEIFWYGQFINKAPRLNARRTGVTS